MLDNWQDYIRNEIHRANDFWRAQATSGVCVWGQKSVGDDSWYTACDNVFIIIDGKPSDNKMEYCCYCGKELRQEI